MNKYMSILLFCLIWNCSYAQSPLEKLDKFSVKNFPPPQKKQISPPIKKLTGFKKPSNFKEKEITETIDLRQSLGPEKKKDSFYLNEPELVDDERIYLNEPDLVDIELPAEPISFRHPIQFVPETLSSVGYVFSSDVHSLLAKAQFHFGQYKFLENYLEKYGTVLNFKPHLGLGAVVNKEAMSFYVETYNSVKINKEYGAGFKLILDGQSLHFGKTSFNGYVQGFLFRSFRVASDKRYSVYAGFSSLNIPINLDQGFKKYIKKSKELILKKENMVVGLYFNPDITSTLSFSVETNARNYASIFIYYGLK